MKITALVNVGIGAFGIAAGEQIRFCSENRGAACSNLHQQCIPSIYHPQRSVVPRKQN
ncbi:hypothetical protein [Sodalis sp. RH16]|uniref:hypothetical protein n=1 Tax=Sodalis sp. RH16 TaxID=3394331 RepID=UPI0039B5CEFB